jgi:hypothetical protein
MPKNADEIQANLVTMKRRGGEEEEEEETRRSSRLVF